MPNGATNSTRKVEGEPSVEHHAGELQIGIQTSTDDMADGNLASAPVARHLQRMLMLSKTRPKSSIGL